MALQVEQRRSLIWRAGLALKRQITSTEKQIDDLMDRLVDASSELTAKAYERKIERLEKERLLAQDKLANGLAPTVPQGKMIELAPKFLSNLCKLWESGNLTLQKMVLRLAFAEHLAYSRIEGYRTPETNLPFKVLGDVSMLKCKVVPPAGCDPCHRHLVSLRLQRFHTLSRPKVRYQGATLVYRLVYPWCLSQQHHSYLVRSASQKLQECN